MVVVGFHRRGGWWKIATATASHHTAPTRSHQPHTKTITMADHGSNKGFIVKGLVVVIFHRRESLVEDVAAMLNTTVVSCSGELKKWWWVVWVVAMAVGEGAGVGV
ncbi:hypothetical protein E3N88_33711 [Mikania micrantha]|uniref:Uncharacterized protein n=1 Tax=Mikania micrantha TaxID=192012 RepID=A0A5N6MCA4_9ASTR|nr:hypothetical protein E3N88_33711 [Mikania micrantha]